MHNCINPVTQERDRRYWIICTKRGGFIHIPIQCWNILWQFRIMHGGRPWELTILLQSLYSTCLQNRLLWCYKVFSRLFGGMKGDKNMAGTRRSQWVMDFDGWLCGSSWQVCLYLEDDIIPLPGWILTCPDSSSLLWKGKVLTPAWTWTESSREICWARQALLGLHSKTFRLVNVASLTTTLEFSSRLKVVP